MAMIFPGRSSKTIRAHSPHGHTLLIEVQIAFVCHFKHTAQFFRHAALAEGQGTAEKVQKEVSINVRRLRRASL